MSASLYIFLALLSCATVVFIGTLYTRVGLSEENLSQLATANNALALNILRQLTAKSSGNIFFSPLSLSTAFGMLYYGTKGETAKELRKALGYETASLQEGLVHKTFHHYLTESLPSNDRSAYVLNVANAIFVDKHLDLVPSYKAKVQKLYQASVRDVDFASQASQVTNEINNWVKDKTNGKIDKLLDDVDPDTILMLLNAVYFKGTWKTQFGLEDTIPSTFYNNGLDSGAKKRPMMRMTSKFPYTKLHNAEILEMPYKGEDISMVILLPKNRNGLESLERSLTLEKLSKIRQQLVETQLELFIPKFKLSYSAEMSDDFQSIGAKSIFTPGADFSGITPTRNIFVSQVFHKAVVEVNEEGSEAAAVTQIVYTRSMDYDPIFRVDHPFLFAIVDRRSDMILFLGHVKSL